MDSLEKSLRRSRTKDAIIAAAQSLGEDDSAIIVIGRKRTETTESRGERAVSIDYYNIAAWEAEGLACVVQRDIWESAEEDDDDA